MTDLKTAPTLRLLYTFGRYGDTLQTFEVKKETSGQLKIFKKNCGISTIRRSDIGDNYFETPLSA